MGRGGKGGGAKRREEQASRRVRGGLCGTEGLVRGWEGGWVRLLERRALRGSAGCSRRRRALLVELRHVSWGKVREPSARGARAGCGVVGEDVDDECWVWRRPPCSVRRDPIGSKIYSILPCSIFGNREEGARGRGVPRCMVRKLYFAQGVTCLSPRQLQPRLLQLLPLNRCCPQTQCLSNTTHFT